MNEIAWFKDRGLVSSYEDYLNLPLAVINDERLRAEGESLKQQRLEKAARGRR